MTSPSLPSQPFYHPHPTPPTKKTSLDFLCSPPTPSSSSSLPSLSMATDDMPRRMNGTTSVSTPNMSRYRLDTLPRNLLAQIAVDLVIEPDGNSNPRHHPSRLIPFFLTSRTIYDAVSFDNNPQLYNTLFRKTFDTAALERRYKWMQKHLAQQAGRGRKIFDLFSDPRSWAIDYKTRWEQTARMRRVAEAGTFEGICEREQVLADLWTVWFLLTENDGRNLPFLARECRFEAWMVVYYNKNLLQTSLIAGYPQDTGEKALAMWCSLLSGTDVSSEQTPAEVDEKIFVMRPYVFACAKYDITYAPWTQRRLPLCKPGCSDHEPDITLRSKALTYKRFGYSWRRAPPHFILGVYLAFLRLVERQPGRMGLKPGSSTFVSPPGEGPAPGLFSVTKVLPSIYHDCEWQRNSVCQDPHDSPGLPSLTFRGQIEGFWRCKFLFFDFDRYRQVLAGDIRGVYTGTFAEQATEMQLKETVIKVRKEDVGGKGPLLCAGFDLEGEGFDPEEDQKRIQEGYGAELCLDEDEPDEEGWTKEILISGSARTSWGYADVRGRVRSWDGLVMLCCSYSRHALGKWLWRGYIHPGGHLIGRWRDTFTPEHLRGYEGALGMIRAGDVYYPPQYPKGMDESEGVDQGILPGANSGGPSFPSQTLIGQSRARDQRDPEQQIHDFSTPQAQPSLEPRLEPKAAPNPDHNSTSRSESTADVQPRVAPRLQKSPPATRETKPPSPTGPRAMGPPPLPAVSTRTINHTARTGSTSPTTPRHVPNGGPISPGSVLPRSNPIDPPLPRRPTWASEPTPPRPRATAVEKPL